MCLWSVTINGGATTMAMMNSTRAILLFVLGTCLYQPSLAEEGTGALYRHIAMLSARGMEMNVVHVSKLPDDSVREQSVRRERDVNAERLALATMVGCRNGSECTNYPDCTPGWYCTADQFCTRGLNCPPGGRAPVPGPAPVPAPVTPTASGLVATIWQLLFGYSILSIIRLQRWL